MNTATIEFYEEPKPEKGDPRWYWILVFGECRAVLASGVSCANEAEARKSWQQFVERVNSAIASTDTAESHLQPNLKSTFPAIGELFVR